jgi:hypothetical protein
VSDTSGYAGDGVTKPGSINDNAQSSYSAGGGGYFRVRAKAYYKRGPFRIRD